MNDNSWRQHAGPDCEIARRPQPILATGCRSGNATPGAEHQGRLTELGRLLIWNCDFKAGDGLAERIHEFLNCR